MQVRQVTYAPSGDFPLYITAKQYWLPEVEQDAEGEEAVTLIMLHSTSFHKETWEPTVERVLNQAQLDQAALKGARSAGSGRSLRRDDMRRRVKIRCAWAIECPNHGESAQLNETALQHPPFYRTFTCEKYAQAVHRFLSAGLEHDAKTDFRRQNLVGIGHSLGACAMTLLQNVTPAFPFSTLVLVEPMMSAEGPGRVQELRLNLIKYAYERQDVWASRDAARQKLTSLQRRTEGWDPQVMELFIRHGLRMHSGAAHVDAPYNGVTLACSREEEAAMYRDAEGATKPVEVLNTLCSRVPIHVLFGAVNDYIPRSVHDALVDPKSPRKFASISRIDGAGHLVPQMAPEKLSHALYDIITANPSPTTSCKL